MFGFSKKPKKQEGYTYRPPAYDRDQKIALQKIVSNVPVTRRLLPQNLLVVAVNNYVIKNTRAGADAARNVNTTKDPQLFFASLRELIETTENLKKVEPYWRFDKCTPTEQMEEIERKRDKLIRGFLSDSFDDLVNRINAKRSPGAKQKVFDEYQNAILAYSDDVGEENFEFFKQLCREKLNIVEETPDAPAEAEADRAETPDAPAEGEAASEEGST